MLETKNLIYLDISKTAGTHIRKILKQVLNEDILSGKKNKMISQEEGKKFKISSIRNPWDWYLSLWSYGCQGQGKLFEQLKEKYQHLYERSNSENFREWLELINEPELLDSDLFDDKMYGSKTYKNIGIYTCRYLRAVHPRFKKLFSGELDSYDKILALHQQKDDINCYVRVHQLESDLIFALQQAKVAGVSLKENYREIIKAASEQPTNTSRKGRKPFTEYYDDETKKLVHRQEKLIIEQFGFRFDPTECITTKLNNSKKTKVSF